MRTAYVYNFLLEANVMATIAIVLMFVLRKVLKKQLSSRALCFGWLMVAIRLLCPLTLPNPFISSIRPQAVWDNTIRPISGQLMVRARDALSELYSFARTDIGITEESIVSRGIHSAYTGMWNGNFPQLLMLVYILVLCLITGWFVFCNVRFHIQLKKSRVEPLSGELLTQYHTLCEKLKVKPLPVYLCDPLPGACLAGILRPCIALPLTANKEDALLMLEHELCHYKNRDHWFALVRLVCCAVHWFNPLVWLAAHLSRTDMELRCDERVIQHKTEEEKQAYAALLVTSAAKRAAPGLSITATGMTITAKRLKTRVLYIMSDKATIRALGIAFAAVCCLLLIGAFCTSEYVPFVRIPTFQSGMLPPLQPLEDRISAIDVAKIWAASPLIDAGIEDTEWSNVLNSADEPRAYVVQTTQFSQRYFSMTIHQDGSILSISNRPRDFYDQEGTTNRKEERWYPKLADFLYTCALQMNPDLDGKLGTPEMHRDYWVGDVRYVYYQIPVELEGYAYIHATVQVAPDFRLIELGGGNG